MSSSFWWNKTGKSEEEINRSESIENVAQSRSKTSLSKNLAKIRELFGSVKEEPAKYSDEDEGGENMENNFESLTDKTDKGAEPCNSEEKLSKKDKVKNEKDENFEIHLEQTKKKLKVNVKEEPEIKHESEASLDEIKAKKSNIREYF